MNIAIDTSPIDASSGHKVRGVGMYLTTLKENLERLDKENTYTFFTDYKKLDKAVDLVHFPYFDPFFITFPLLKKKATVFTVHDVIPLVHREKFPVGIKGRFKWGVNKRILLSADGIITDSIASKNSIHRLTRYPLNKIHVVYLGVGNKFKRVTLSEKRKEELVGKYNLPERFVLYVGDVTWNKNLPRLVDAINSLNNVPLVMVGKALADKNFDAGNPWNNDKNYLIKNTQDDKFHIVGFLPDDDLVALYNMAEALVMPSLDEGFGLPVLEAMTCGCPVVASSEGSLPEVAGDAALYVDARSVTDIAEKIRKLWDDGKLRKELSKKGVQQAEKFSVERMIEDTIQAYKTIYEAAR